MGFRLMLGKEVREQVRTLRLPVVLIVFGLIGLLSPVTARYIREIIDAVGGQQYQGLVPEPTVADAVVQLTKNLGQFGVLIAVLVTMGSVTTEKERGTAAFLLTKPISRGAFLAAKAASIGLLLALATALAVALAWFYTAVLFETLGVIDFALVALLIWLSLCAFAAVTFLASATTRSALVAGGVGIAVLLLSGVLGALPGMGAYLPTSLWGAADGVALGRGFDDALGSLLAAIGLIVVALALAWFAFRRQEL
jgi:ABC-2 type transport system permease protein